MRANVIACGRGALAMGRCQDNPSITFRGNLAQVSMCDAVAIYTYVHTYTPTHTHRATPGNTTQRAIMMDSHMHASTSAAERTPSTQGTTETMRDGAGKIEHNTEKISMAHGSMKYEGSGGEICGKISFVGMEVKIRDQGNQGGSQNHFHNSLSLLSWAENVAGGLPHS